MKNLQIYITYDSDDILLVNFIKDALTSLQIFDAFYILHDEYKEIPLFSKIRKHNIENSDIIMAIFTKSSVWSDLIKEELDYAKSINKIRIPLVETSSKLRKISNITGTLVTINFDKNNLNKKFINRLFSNIFLQCKDIDLSTETKNKKKKEIVEYANNNWNLRMPLKKRLEIYNDIINDVLGYMNYNVMMSNYVFKNKEINLIVRHDNMVIYILAKLFWVTLKDMYKAIESRGSANDVWLIGNDFTDKVKTKSKNFNVKLYYTFEFIKSLPYGKYKTSDARLHEILYKRKYVYDRYEDASYLNKWKISIENFNNIINSDNINEEILQKYLENNAMLLDPLSKKIFKKHKLGSEFIADFIIEKLNNIYILVELEPSSYKLYTKNGNQTKELRQAIKQIEDWQRWISNNINYARNKLENILNPKGMVVIGRKKNLNEQAILRLNYFNSISRSNYEIYTYDDLIENNNLLLQNLIRHFNKK